MRRHDDRQRVLVLWLALPGLGLAAGCDDDPGGDPVDMAVVQDGPLMMDGHMPDMAIDATVDAGEGDAGDVGTGPATCEVQCGRLADCAAGDGCPGYTAENRDGIMTACLQTCTPMLAEVVAGMATCPPVLELARTASADFAAGCNPLPCEEARDRVIDCLLEDVPVDLCPNLGPGERDAVIAHLDRAGLTCPDAAFALNVRAVRPTCAAVVEAHLGDPSRSAMCQGVTLSPACDAVGACDVLTEISL